MSDYLLRDDEEVAHCVGGPRFDGATMVIKVGTSRINLPYIPDLSSSFLKHQEEDEVEFYQDEYIKEFKDGKAIFRFIEPSGIHV